MIPHQKLLSSHGNESSQSPDVVLNDETSEEELLQTRAQEHMMQVLICVIDLHIDKIECKFVFVMAKDRLAPIDIKGEPSLTLPKLELTALLCVARLHFIL